MTADRRREFTQFLPGDNRNVKTEAELAAVANLNFIGSYRKLVEHSSDGAIRERGGVFAFATGVPVALFNGCIVTEPVTPADLDAALDWIDRRGSPYLVLIDEKYAPGPGDVAIAHGLVREPATYPGMVLHPVSGVPSPPAAVTVVQVSGAGLAEYIGVCVEAGMPPELARRVYPPAFAADPDVQLFTARLDGRPVGTSMAIRTGEVAGVYAVGTLPGARRRGVATAASWAAVVAGAAWGCDTIVLQSSEMAFSLYSAMGFRTVVSYTAYRQASPA
jgi:GNAT superfamily N-acetyltransferase